MDDNANQRRMEHRRKNYRQYNLIVEQGTLLEALLERYREMHHGDRENTLSKLIRECLCYCLEIMDGQPFQEYRLQRGSSELLPGHDLDALLDALEKRIHPL